MRPPSGTQSVPGWQTLPNCLVYSIVVEKQLVPYKKLPVWTADSLPAGFREQHNTKDGTWAKLTVLQGTLTFYALNEAGEVQSTQAFSPTNPAPFVEPQAWHKVAPASGDLRCYLEFYCQPERYYEKKYGLTAPHSEVIGVLEHIRGGDALDLGCGRGRNSIFLETHGFRVTALDHSESSIATLNKIISEEKECQGIQADRYDISTASLENGYGLIVSTVVFQFLPPECIPKVIDNMQTHTHAKGINLIVAPVSTDTHPCPIDWPFTFKENELKGYYDAWSLIKYNENMGTFHRLDENGNPYQAKFATLVARKPPDIDLEDRP